MSTGSPLDDKELVRQAIDIVELVGNQIQLRRQGRNFVGICPWHDDSRPSLQVNPERQSFKCWVCDIGGDIFSWVMRIEGVEFREALEMLADRAGISLARQRAPARHVTHEGIVEDGMPSDDMPPPETVGFRSVEGKRTLYKAMAWAESEYHKCLVESPEGEPARRYLQERGITSESIERFQLGFAPNQRDWILDRAQGDPRRAKILEAIGLLAPSQNDGSYYERFRGRVLFSIRDTQGRPVGLGGRVLPESGNTSPAKYVNSPETPLFTKSKLLYAQDIARDAMRKTRTVLVMEGYTDVIVAHQYGFDNAVAVLGTALGEQHVRTLGLVDRIVLVLDGDEAGQRRTNEILSLFVAQEVNLDVLTLPAGSDPCDFLQTHGAQALSDLIENEAVNALDHAYRTLTRGIDVENDVTGVERAVESMLATVAQAPRLGARTDAQRRNREWKIVSSLALKFRIPENAMRQRLTELRRRQKRRPAAPPSVDMDSQENTELPVEKPTATVRELLELLIRHPECLPEIRADVDPGWIRPESCRQIYRTCCRLFDQDVTPEFGRLMLEFDDPDVKSLLVELDESGSAKGDRDADPATLLQQLVETFQQQETERRHATQIAALREGGLDDSQEDELLKTIQQQARSRQGISEPTDG